MRIDAAIETPGASPGQTTVVAVAVNASVAVMSVELVPLHGWITGSSRPMARSICQKASAGRGWRKRSSQVATTAACHERGELRAVGGEVRQPQRHASSLSSSFCSSRRSRSVRPFSLSRWTSRGRAEPSNTRSTNSRTIDLTTCCCGRTGA